MTIQLGLCCLNTTLKKQKPSVYPSRKMTMKKINEENGIEELKSRIIKNLKDVLTMMDWNEKHNIKVFRLSSDLFPHKSNIKIDDYGYEFAKDLLIQIGEKSKKYNQRLTFHPGQYNVLGTPHEKALEQTIRDLSYHADVLDMMKLDKNSVIVIHGGGFYNDKEKTKERWCENFKNLPENVRNRLVLENCEKCFSIKDCLEISEKINIPVVFDTHHFECYKLLHPLEHFEHPSEYIENILKTWEKRNIKPKFHISEQGMGKIGHHSDYIEKIPDYLKNIKVDIDIMVEAKMKELAIFKLRSLENIEF